MSSRLVVVGGPSGVGKTTVGRLLARSLGVAFCDADDLHPAENIALMHAGKGLDDAARAPWLAEVGRWLTKHEGEGGVTACSALAWRYRETLRRAAPQLKIAMLLTDAAQLTVRLDQRRGHFMSSTLLSEQLALYEAPRPGEPAAEFDAGVNPGSTACQIAKWLATLSTGVDREALSVAATDRQQARQPLWIGSAGATHDGLVDHR